MCHLWRRVSQRFVEQQVLGYGRQPLFAADDVRDLHRRIVHDVGQVVRRQAVRLDEHLIVYGRGVERHVAADQVGERDRPAGLHLEADDVVLPGIEARLGVGRRSATGCSPSTCASRRCTRRHGRASPPVRRACRRRRTRARRRAACAPRRRTGRSARTAGRARAVRRFRGWSPALRRATARPMRATRKCRPRRPRRSASGPCPRCGARTCRPLFVPGARCTSGAQAADVEQAGRAGSKANANRHRLKG